MSNFRSQEIEILTVCDRGDGSGPCSECARFGVASFVNNNNFSVGEAAAFVCNSGACSQKLSAADVAKVWGVPMRNVLDCHWSR